MTNKSKKLLKELDQAGITILDYKASEAAIRTAIDLINSHTEVASPILIMLAKHAETRLADAAKCFTPDQVNYPPSEALSKYKQLLGIWIRTLASQIVNNFYLLSAVLTYCISAVFLARLTFLLEVLSFDFKEFFEFIRELSFKGWLEFLTDWDFNSSREESPGIVGLDNTLKEVDSFSNLYAKQSFDDATLARLRQIAEQLQELNNSPSGSSEAPASLRSQYKDGFILADDKIILRSVLENHYLWFGIAAAISTGIIYYAYTDPAFFITAWDYVRDFCSSKPATPPESPPSDSLINLTDSPSKSGTSTPSTKSFSGSDIQELFRPVSPVSPSADTANINVKMLPVQNPNAESMNAYVERMNSLYSTPNSSQETIKFPSKVRRSVD